MVTIYTRLSLRKLICWTKTVRLLNNSLTSPCTSLAVYILLFSVIHAAGYFV